MNPLTSFFRLFDFRKFKVIDVIQAENEEEADKIFRKKRDLEIENRFNSLS